MGKSWKKVNTKKQIEFVRDLGASTTPEFTNWVDLPVTAKKIVPEWYKQTERFTGGKLDVHMFVSDPTTSSSSNTDLGACVPFLDSMLSGYLIQLWTDVIVTKDEGGTYINWLVAPKVVEIRQDSVAQHLPCPPGFLKKNMAWVNPIAVKTPPGYSALITHPFNRFDLPFLTMSGIVDSDSYHSGGNVPFWLSDTFEGIIPKGTPIVQVFPFKRDNWESKEGDETMKDAVAKSGWLARSVASGYYKRNNWTKKSFE